MTTHPQIGNPFVAKHYLRDHPEILSIEKDTDGKDQLCLTFKDPAQFYLHADEFAVLQKHPSSPFNGRMKQSVVVHGKGYGGGFNETLSYTEYLEKRNAVDQDPRFENIAALTETLTDDLIRTGQFSVRRRGHDVYGDTPDVPRAVSGDLMAMHLWKGQKQINRLSLSVPFGGSCNLSAKFLSNYGIAISAMTEALEHRGTRVRLITGNITQGYGSRAPVLKTDVTLKPYSQSLDVGEVVQFWVQTDTFRRAWFTYVEMCNHEEWVSSFSGTYGSPRGYNYMDDELCINLPPPDTLYRNMSSDATAQQISEHLFPLISKKEAA